MSSDAEVLFERRGSAGVVTLNRPKALNALTREMAIAFAVQLREWTNDAAVTRVVVTAAGDRAFSAGGDIRKVYELAKAGRPDEAVRFFRDEYRLNALIHRFPKPYVSLIDGIVMGGGLGLSVHGSHRIAGDAFLMAMPEVGIGFFPDIGATWFLPRLPGKLGTYLALTADRLKLADGLGTGIATHHVPSQQFAELAEALCGSESVDDVVARFAKPCAPGPVMARRPIVDRMFSGERVGDILDALDREGEGSGADAEWARATAATMRTKSPTSQCIALAQMQRGGSWSFEECMRAEYRIVSRVVYGHDFIEGVRAVIIDKDNAPKWKPSKLSDVSMAEVERHFAPLAQELAFS